MCTVIKKPIINKTKLVYWAEYHIKHEGSQETIKNNMLPYALNNLLTQKLFVNEKFTSTDGYKPSSLKSSITYINLRKIQQLYILLLYGSCRVYKR
jgi:hypothetical protein